MLSFYKALLMHPKSIGAVIPSSAQLAKAIAAFTPTDPNNRILELGPGTGIITKAILKKGLASEQLILVEKSASMVKTLEKKFPACNIMIGDALKLDRIITDENRPIDIVISSLPLTIFPPIIVTKIIEQIEKVLKPDGLLIQYTYRMKKPCLFIEHGNFVKIKSKIVWPNIPPARIDVCRKTLDCT